MILTIIPSLFSIVESLLQLRLCWNALRYFQLERLLLFISVALITIKVSISKLLLYSKYGGTNLVYFLGFKGNPA